MEGFVEWSILEEKLPLLYTQYGMGGKSYLEEKVILPYAPEFFQTGGIAIQRP